MTKPKAKVTKAAPKKEVLQEGEVLNLEVTVIITKYIQETRIEYKKPITTKDIDVEESVTLQVKCHTSESILAIQNRAVDMVKAEYKDAISTNPELIDFRSSCCIRYCGQPA
jgi:hypothetical protein